MTTVVQREDVKHTALTEPDIHYYISSALFTNQIWYWKTTSTYDMGYHTHEAIQCDSFVPCSGLMLTGLNAIMGPTGSGKTT